MKAIVTIFFIAVVFGVGITTASAEETSAGKTSVAAPASQSPAVKAVVPQVSSPAAANDAEDMGDDTSSDSIVETAEEYMTTREVEGVVKTASADTIIVTPESGQEIKLVVDAETLVYINDEKKALTDIKAGDSVFAYYVEEDGVLKGDWIEITR